MFEILMFLFENYMHNQGGVSLAIDHETIFFELEKIGFHRYDIHRALDWLDGLNRFQVTLQEQAASATMSATRYYLPEEYERLGIDGWGLLAYLERVEILDPVTREIAIDRIMALDPREVDLSTIKWIILMVLFNQPEKRPKLLLLQDMILADVFNVLH